MNSYTVRISESAEAGIVEQVLYIARDLIANAARWEQRLTEAIDRLGELSHGYPVEPELTSRLNVETRRMVFEKTYIVSYQVEEADRNVVVVQFRHGARLPDANE